MHHSTFMSQPIAQNLIALTVWAYGTEMCTLLVKCRERMKQVTNSEGDTKEVNGTE